MTHTISTTMQPDVVLEVDDAEYADLSRQGLIAVTHSEQAAAPAPAPSKKAATPATTKEG